MSKMQGILRSLYGFNLSPKDLFVRANHLLCRDLEKRSYITAVGALFDASRKQIILARAGHLPVFHYQARTQAVDLVTPKGLGLGLEDAQLFADQLEERIIAYQSGDVFVFVTDGVTEAHNGEGLEFGEEKLLTLLQSIPTLSANEIRDHIIDEVTSFSNQIHQRDDVTVVVVKVV
jgi:serine phosphatase RsbU (regulator of sigma subunit)